MSKEAVFERLSGTDSCIDQADSGRLRRELFGDTRALVCTECGTPAVRVW